MDRLVLNLISRRAGEVNLSSERIDAKQFSRRLVQRARARRPKYRSALGRCMTGRCVVLSSHELVRREIVEARMRAHFVVERSLRTPTGPRSAKLRTVFILGRGGSSTSMKWSRRRAAMLPGAAWTARKRLVCWSCRRGCSTGWRVRRCAWTPTLGSVSPRWMR